MYQVILPSDFVVGDIEVDENGPLPGQVLSGDAGPDNDDEENNDNGNDSTAGSVAPGGDGGGADGVTDAAALDVEPEDPAMGFEYEGEVNMKKPNAFMHHRGPLVNKESKRSTQYQSYSLQSMKTKDERGVLSIEQPEPKLGMCGRKENGTTHRRRLE